MSWSAVPSSPEMTIGRKAVLKTAGRENGIFLSAAARFPQSALLCGARSFLAKKKQPIGLLFMLNFDYALSTKPERKQEVHTFILRAPPLTFTLTDFTFAFHILLERL